MTKWIAFIIVSATPNPTILTWPDDNTPQPSIGVDVNDGDVPDAAFSMHMRRGGSRIAKMTDVETNTVVNVSTTQVIEFPTEELCLAAAATLRLQYGVISVSCLQING